MNHPAALMRVAIRLTIRQSVTAGGKNISLVTKGQRLRPRSFTNNFRPTDCLATVYFPNRNAWKTTTLENIISSSSSDHHNSWSACSVILSIFVPRTWARTKLLAASRHICFHRIQHHRFSEWRLKLEIFQRGFKWTHAEPFSLLFKQSCPNGSRERL